MKKVLFIFVCLSVTFIEALPVGNPSFPKMSDKGLFTCAPKWIQARAAYEGAFDINQKLINKQEDRIDDFKRDSQGALLTVGFQNRFDFYTVLGENKVRSDWRFSIPSGGTSPEAENRIESETYYNFFYALGLRGILYEWGCLSLSCGVRYQKSSPQVMWITQNGTSMENIETAEQKNIKPPYWELTEWQVDMGLSYKIQCMVPYVAIKYLRTENNFFSEQVISTEKRTSSYMVNENRIGYALGLGINPCKVCYVNLEISFRSDQTGTITAECKF